VNSLLHENPSKASSSIWCSKQLEVMIITFTVFYIITVKFSPNSVEKTLRMKIWLVVAEKNHWKVIIHIKIYISKYYRFGFKLEMIPLETSVNKVSNPFVKQILICIYIKYKIFHWTRSLTFWNWASKIYPSEIKHVYAQNILCSIQQSTQLKNLNIWIVENLCKCIIYG
jgi:hypothetical protein